MYFANEEFDIKKSLILLLLFLDIVITFCANIFGSNIVYGNTGDNMRITWILLIWPSLILFFLNFHTISSVLFNNKLLKHLGTISMSVYIFHWPILQSLSIANEIFLLNFDLTPGKTLFIVIIMIILVSEIMHKYVEPKIV